METSSAVCSVALSGVADQIVSIKSHEHLSHAKELVPLIQACLKKADCSWDEISAVAVSGGPGSFTGLRVGASTAKGICFARGLPLIAVDTLLALAHAGAAACGIVDGDQMPADVYHIPMIDARRNEVYTKCFNSIWKEIHPLQALDLEKDHITKYVENAAQVIISTDNRSKLPPLNSKFRIVECTPEASSLCALAQAALKNKRFVDVSLYTPAYLKSPNITTSKKTL